MIKRTMKIVIILALGYISCDLVGSIHNPWAALAIGFVAGSLAVMTDIGLGDD